MPAEFAGEVVTIGMEIMERLGIINVKPHLTEEYGPRWVCSHLGMADASPELGGDDVAVRLVFMPSFDPEVVLTIRMGQDRCVCSVRSARMNLYTHSHYGAEHLSAGDRPLASPVHVWGVDANIDPDRVVILRMDRSALDRIWRTQEGIAMLDGCQIGLFRVDPSGAYTAEGEGCSAWTDEAEDVCAEFLAALMGQIKDGDTAALLRRVAAYFERPEAS